MPAPKKKSKFLQYQYRKNRLESFHKGVTLGKAKKLVAWPDTHLDSELLATLGFFYQPTLQHKDQIQCFCCSKKIYNLKKLTESEILQEMDCDYSKLMKFMRREDDADSILSDPENSKAVKLRLSTFVNFPASHPSSESLAKAGFIFIPETPGDDSTKCIYCRCVLDGWQTDDDPLVEHKLRNDECLIFLHDIEESDDSETSAVKSPFKVTESKEALSDDDFENSTNKSALNSSLVSRPKNRYGSSKIKKNRIVTTSSNNNSSFADQPAQLRSSQRRSWYREDSDKKRKSSEHEHPDESSSKRSKDDNNDESVMEISAIEDEQIVNTKINGQSVSEVIDSTFSVLSDIPSKGSELFVLEQKSASPVVARTQTTEVSQLKNQTKGPRSRKATAFQTLDKMIKTQGLLDVIGDSDETSHNAPDQYSEEVFDHHLEGVIFDDDPEPVEVPKEDKADVLDENMPVSHILSELELQDEPVVDYPVEEITNDSPEVQLAALDTEPHKELPSKEPTINESLEDDTQEIKVKRRLRSPKRQQQRHDETLDSDIEMIKEPVEVNESSKKIDVVDSSIADENQVPISIKQPALPQQTKKSKRLTVEEKIEEENRTIYADRRRTRSSMAPYSPPKSKNSKDEHEIEEDAHSNRRRTRSSMIPNSTEVNKEEKDKSKKVTKKSKAKSKTATIPKVRNSSVPKEINQDEVDLINIVERDLQEVEQLSSQNTSQSSARKGISSGSLIGSPDPSEKTARNQKRRSLLKLMRERNSRLYNSSSQREDSSLDVLPVKPKIVLKPRDSLLLNKSPGKSPLKPNKLIDAEEDKDIFSLISPVRPEKKRGKSFGIDKIALELGKDIFSDASFLKNASPQLVKEETPVLSDAPPLNPPEPVSPEISTKTSTNEKKTISIPLPRPVSRPESDSENEDEDDRVVPEEKSQPIKVVIKRQSDEHESNTSSPAQPSSSSLKRGGSQRPSLRLSLLANNSPERSSNNQKSPIMSARFEINEIDDDVILADDDIRSGDNTNKLNIGDKADFEESSRRTSKIAATEDSKMLSSPQKDLAPVQEDEKEEELEIPGIIAEFNESSNNNTVISHTNNKADKTPNTLSIQNLNPAHIKSSTPLNLMGMEAESTPLENPPFAMNHKEDKERKDLAKEMEKAAIQEEEDSSRDLEKTSLDNSNADEAKQDLDLKWDPSESTLLNQIISDIESTGDYLTKITNSPYQSLNEDLDGELTNFISQMPDEELEMTVKEWILHNAKQLKNLLALNLQQMVELFDKEGERLLAMLEKLPVKDDEVENHQT